MKIAIPTDEKDINSGVCVSFGRAPYFVLYDTESNETKYIDNSAISAQSGAGIKASQVIVDAGADALVTPRLGENASVILKEAGIKLYQSVFGSAKINIEKCAKGELEVLTKIQAGFQYHGGM